MNLIELISKYDDLLIISNNSYMTYIIENLSCNNKLNNYTYKTFFEASNELLGSYDLSARLKFQKENKISSDLATIILNTSILVENDKLDTNKLKQLKSYKDKYKLVKNNLSINRYINRPILIINYYHDNDLFNKALNIIKNHNSNIIFYSTFKDVNDKVTIYSFNNIKDEINNLLIEVASLIDKNINPEKIKVHIPSSYYNYANEVFSLANIDLNIKYNYSLSDYEITKKILLDLENYLEYKVDLAFTNVLTKYKYENNKILDLIVNVFNRYVKYEYLLKDIFEDLKYTLKSRKYVESYIGGIKVCNIMQEVVNDDDYVFILGLNQDVFPTTFKDDDYLLDFEKELQNLVTSKEKNKIEFKKSKDLILSKKNIYLSYSKVTNVGLTPKSSIINKLQNYVDVKIIDKEVDYNISYSEKLDKLQLGKLLDLYYKYDAKSSKLYSLYNKYSDIDYKKYDNRFTGISSEMLDKHLKNGLYLSYTSIDKYYKCSFLYYLENVLKIRRSTNTDALFIGSLVHDILYRLLNEKEIDEIDSFVNKAVSEYVIKNEKVISPKEKFFINKYKSILKHLLVFIKDQTDNSDFYIFGLEKEFTLTLPNKIPVYLQGKIDKILTLKVNDTKYAIVVDYKTGDTSFDLNRVVHGLNMQIIFYFYLLNNYSYDFYNFAGGYLQGVLPSSELAYSADEAYTDKLYNYFKLNGYSTDDITILKNIERNIIPTSKYINGIRFKQDASFYSTTYKKLISKDVFKRLLKICEDKIHEAVDSIISGKFDINPKKVSNKIDACTFCSYKDICFKKNKDYVELKDYQEFEFLGGHDDTN